MDLLDITQELCAQYGIHPSRSKGQNFLINEEAYDRIVEAADLKKDDIVLEVGPGLGFLTERLAKRTGKVITVELDDKLAKLLKKRLASQKIENVEIINDDITKLEIGNWKLNKAEKAHQVLPRSLGKRVTEYKIVANLPYNITSFFLRQYLSSDIKPRSIILMLQKEVAERISAQPPKMSLLAVSVQYYARAEVVVNIDKDNFWPEPAVDSAIVKIVPHKETEFPIKNSVSGIEEKEFFRLVRMGFSARRKKLKNNLAAGFHVSSEDVLKQIKLAGFSENIRAQELSVADWQKLFGAFRQFML